jgi:hypothetical protein
MIRTPSCSALPSFDPDDDTYRVLLEIVDRNQIVRSLLGG